MTKPTLFGTLTPAYGRDYKTGEDALKDWNAGKDFRINNPIMSTYCSIRDTETDPVGSTLQIRWNRNTEVGIIEKGEDGKWRGEFTPIEDELQSFDQESLE